MEMLTALGFNGTIVIQFFLFLIGYVILTRLVFKPYYSAYMERYNRTVGSEDKATQIIAETEVLEQEFEENAKALNFKIKNIYDVEKKSALSKQEKLIKDAQLKASELKQKSNIQLEENRTKILNELEQEVTPLANLIKETVIG